MNAVTVRACMERYITEHGPMVVDQRRIDVAWNNMKPLLSGVLVGKNIFALTSTYYRRRIMAGVVSATVRRELAVLEAAFKYCFKIGLIPYVPAIFRAKDSTPKMLVLNNEEVTRLLVAATKEPHWLFRFSLLLAHTGQRKEAVLGLTWPQVDMETRIIDFNAVMTMPERRKGRGVVPINDELFMYLKEWAAVRKGPYVMFKDGVERPRSIYYAWDKLIRRAGLNPDTTPHTLRHSVATMLVRAGEDIRKVQLMLGHVSIVTTEKNYVKNDAETIRSTVQKLTFNVRGKENA